MEKKCLNRVEFAGARVNEVIKAFKDTVNPKGSKLIERIIKGLDEHLDVETSFSELSFTEKGINFYSYDYHSADEITTICDEFEVDCTLKYDYCYEKQYGLIVYSYQNNKSEDYYILSECDIKKVTYNQTKKSGKLNKKGTCILEGIEYSSNTEAFDILLDRKANKNDLCISDVIESLVEAELEANPELFEEILTPKCSLELKKLKELVEKYNAYEYINYKSKLIDKVLCANSYEEVSDYIRTHYIDKVLFFVSNHKDYFKGIEISNDEYNLEKYWDIQYDVVEKIADKLIDKAIDAFCDWEIEAKLYFLILVDKNKITPTKEIFKDFMDNPDNFIREMNIPQLLAA